MPVTGKKASFIIDDSADAPQDISDNCNNVSLPSSMDTAETTSFDPDNATGKFYKTYIGGLIDHTLSIDGFFDSASDKSDEVLSGILGKTTPGTFTYAPDNTAGQPEYSGECLCTSYEVSSPVGDLVSFTASFQVTGVVTRGTV